MPRALSYSKLRAELKSVLDEVCDAHDPVYVTRRNGGDVVILSREDYEALDETGYLLRSPANAARLRQALAAPDEACVPMTADELRRLVGP